LESGDGDTLGVLYRCEKKEFAWGGICNFLKRRDIFIDARKGGIWKCMKRKDEESAEWRVARMRGHPLRCPVERSGYPTPPVFLQKSAQTIEKKGQPLQKVTQESSRVRRLLKHRHLGLELCERVACDGESDEGALTEVRQGKELEGLAGISCDIIPFG
jgi:hypothetical protein